MFGVLKKQYILVSQLLNISKTREEIKIMDVSSQCRNINELNPLVKVMVELALAEIEEKGVNPLVVETYRTKERQYYLYCQGRTAAECIAKGISKTFAKKYCDPDAKQVTWTLDSVHIERKAVDIVPQRKMNGIMSAVWNTQDSETQLIIKTMMKYGFEAGANWSVSPDSPHFQVKGDFNKLFYQGHNTSFVTGVIQNALNNKLGELLSPKLKVDKVWGNKTTSAVNLFRKSNKWSPNGKLGAIALKKLLG